MGGARRQGLTSQMAEGDDQRGWVGVIAGTINGMA